MIGQTLIDLIDEAGYLSEPLAGTADRLGVSLARTEAVLSIIHTFEPRELAPATSPNASRLQLVDSNRYDPAMAALLDNLDLLARRDFTGLKRLCGVDDEDLKEMVSEIRRLDPKPGLRFGGGPIQPVVPDVYVRQGPDGGWVVELNSDVLPRVLVNQSYLAKVAKIGQERTGEGLPDRLPADRELADPQPRATAPRTILKVATEIVRQQDAFLVHGVEHLRPLNLRTVADGIAMHKSTVSRVTSNKYVATPRGVFEMKYFFTAAIAGDARRETRIPPRPCGTASSR